MSRSALSKLCLAGGIFVSLVLIRGAGAQPASPPDFSAGDVGWGHSVGAAFLPVQGSPSPVVQDPGGLHQPGGDLAHRRSLQSQSQAMGQEVMKKDNDEIDRAKTAFQARSSCLPSGIPNMFLPANPLVILQTPKEVAMIKQGGEEVQHIYLNVPHSVNFKPSRYGRSVGQYEGDTLVLDTIGQNAKTVVDAYRTPHTEKLQVVGRWHLIDGGKGLEVNITVDNPDTFNRPWSTYVRHERGREPVYEDICAENNLNLFDYHMPVALKPDF